MAKPLKFDIETDKLKAFSQAVTKFLGKIAYVYFRNTSDACVVYVGGVGRWVKLEADSVSSESFSLGIDGVRFFALLKNISEESVLFSLGKTLKVSGSGFSVAFPLLQGLDIPEAFTGPKYPMFDGFLDAVKLGGFVSGDEDSRFAGLLLRPLPDLQITQIAKFSGTAIVLSNIPGVLCDRCVISDSFANLPSSVAFEFFRFSKRGLELFSAFGLSVGAVYLSDTYPDVYDQLGVGTGSTFMQDASGFSFQSSELLEVLGGLKGLVGAEGGAVALNVVGEVGDGSGLACQLVADTVAGVKSEVQLVCEAVGPERVSGFKLHLGMLFKILRGSTSVFSGDLVYLFLTGTQAVVLADATLTKVALLSQMR